MAAQQNTSYFMNTTLHYNENALRCFIKSLL